MMISRARFPCEAPAKKDRHSATPQTSFLSVSLSLFLPLNDASLTLTEMERKKEQEAGPFESGLGVRGVVCMMIFHLKRKKNISQVQAFVMVLTQLYPQ